MIATGQRIKFQAICVIIIRAGSDVPTNSDNGAPPKLPKGWYSKIVVNPNGSIRNGITVPENSETTAILIEYTSQDMLLSFIVKQAKMKSTAKPREIHNNNEGKNHIVAGVIVIFNKGAINSIGIENIKNMGIHPPIVCDMICP